MDFGALPPECNSARMYSGMRSQSMLDAADAWDRLADELYGTASSYQGILSTLNDDGWLGFGADAMTAAVAPYVRWLTGVAGQAQEIAAQARAAARAFETALAATVPPAEIEANRSRLALLTASNAINQDTREIMALEAEYSEMWAQDATAMYRYASASAVATVLRPLPWPAIGDDPDIGQDQLAPSLSAIPHALQSLSRPHQSAAAAAALDRLLKITPVKPPVGRFATAISTSKSMTASGTSLALAAMKAEHPMVVSAAVGRGVLCGRLMVPSRWDGVAMGAVRAIA